MLSTPEKHILELRHAKHHTPVFSYDKAKAIKWTIQFLKNETKTFSVL